MRKQDLKVGEEYAVGSSSRYSRWRSARMKLIDLDGAREVPRSWGGTYSKRGIVMALVDAIGGYGEYRGEAGKEFVLDSARDIQSPWAPYAERKAEFDARQDASRREADRARAVADETETRMRALDLPYTRSGSDFRFTADAMAAIVAMIPDGR